MDIPYQILLCVIAIICAILTVIFAFLNMSEATIVAMVISFITFYVSVITPTESK